jgi:beta-galactosidase GanA
MNSISIYFAWVYHSSAPGIYDFTGIRDVDRVLKDAKSAGLNVIARPGPFINAGMLLRKMIRRCERNLLG